ncbi:trifunctional transcriptional regulator/proline dehydrogenase/L-glutamate gamma-semialdehyde dehydrogenase [Lichenihabitans sp. Uapishka_5]|uniref:trifunctional transcriptional regulator/proline dehydrogenase/L-glutamate gamma-semialdehyde dehydrogenase n=1 Tax=Lichenihabitans sp. Uapishka_5 TaxID=3037302 RepID=UPI0029E81623|nr:trifunctional transcriptional regulator/proline dehydrogenase/L-glutamate gamma-semialdehyde dehydrogenase [Lichenihabitans sp. Uapishka_5]MDX7950062.1 trifunctional transcriptional regulator/proline dehydrogenase/L-glutamate gamma-semialdehyde dehydrogenase [Lichenihabitans sp. Uapishka_5]
MASTTIGVKVDDDLRARLKSAAQTAGLTPHGLIKQSIVSTVEAWEDGTTGRNPTGGNGATHRSRPFLDFVQDLQPQSVLRAKITAAYRTPEPESVPLLCAEARLPPGLASKADGTARKLVADLRAKTRRGGVEGLLQEYSLSSQEGVALMCLAEALLRIPDRTTRDALIRDKIALGDWTSHVGQSPSVFVNAATWGLVVTGKLTATASEAGLGTALTRLIGKGGEPLIRRGTDLAMRMMGEQFVTGQTIGEALANSRKHEGRGFRYSYDMLGEAATTAADADRYCRDYEQAIHAIGAASHGRGIYEGPGISIKLSALHPRYSRAQRDRVMTELLPRVLGLAVLARRYDIGLNIDAEEADRLELSLDLLEALCFAPELSGWNGIGFVVQAYQKRAPFVLDFIVDLARRSSHRLMIRLVKGAYWDSEIKRAQVDGLEGFPVYTRKLYTDLSYLACARKLLKAPDAVFPQFATHNAQTLAAIHAAAGENFYLGQYEFQCLHGMGEPLYDEVVGREKLNRPCRIYAPVGTHETLLAYLVRRLLENGANTSFVNRIADPSVSIDDLVADPVGVAEAMEVVGAPHPKIAAPRDLFGAERPNAAGLDLSNEQRLAALAGTLMAGTASPWQAAPLLGHDPAPDRPAEPVRNPADRFDIVGVVIEATAEEADRAFAAAEGAAGIWHATPVGARAACLRRAADIMEGRMPALIGLLVREAGKSFANAIAEVREAVDFLRYYAGQAERDFANAHERPLGPVVCISPWNFPLAIFTGQVAAALAAGNPVLAKPAEETPLVAARAVEMLREAGVPPAAIQLLPGAGAVGASLVADRRCRGVLFTGSTDVARLIQRGLATRLSPDGHTIPFVAETGGLNAMVVDSSALAEQVVADVLSSAFDSAGQRCSALRLLCLQEDIADRTLAMLKGAMAELATGNPDRLATDVGPVISADARDGILAHIEAARAKGWPVHAATLPDACGAGTFVAPTLIELDHVADLTREVFGPVLHVVRYRRQDLDGVLDAIRATGFGLTFGLHTRLDETIAHVTARVGAGNIYINRNIVGAVVGVQPFGGNGLSGTGPKAGGPLYVKRLVQVAPAETGPVASTPVGGAVGSYAHWLQKRGQIAEARMVETIGAASHRLERVSLPGPVGEVNLYGTKPSGLILARVRSEAGLAAALASCLVTGNTIKIEAPQGLLDQLSTLPPALRASLIEDDADDIAAVLFEGDGDALLATNGEMAARDGAVVPVYGVQGDGLLAGREAFPLERLLEEVVISTNTAAAGGNASLMTIG